MAVSSFRGCRFICRDSSSITSILLGMGVTLWLIFFLCMAIKSPDALFGKKGIDPQTGKHWVAPPVDRWIGFTSLLGGICLGTVGTVQSVRLRYLAKRTKNSNGRGVNKNRKLMRYIIAIIGGLLIFVAVFVLSAFLVPVLPAVLRQPISFGIVYTNNVFGLMLASLAATASFRATLRRYTKEEVRRGRS